MLGTKWIWNSMNRRFGVLGFLAMGILLLGSSVTFADSHYWSVLSGNWSNVSNWGGAAPTSDDNAYIVNGGTATISSYSRAYSIQLGGTNTGTILLNSVNNLVAASASIGYQGTGLLVNSSGYNFLRNDGYTPEECQGFLYLGYYASGSGTYELGGTGYLTTNSGCEYIGFSGKGVFKQTGGINATSELILGHDASGSGTYELGGTGDLTANSGHECVGASGTGVFTQTGGVNVTSTLMLGHYATGKGTYNLEGGTLILKSLQNGVGSAAFNFGGGTLQASGTMSCSLPMTLTGIGGNANIDTAGYDVTLSGNLSGAGGLNKRGSGTLLLSGDDSYHGETHVYEGGLFVLSDSLRYSPLIDVRSGASLNVHDIHLGQSQTLTGGGTIYTSDVIAGAGSHIAPGDGVGTLTINSVLEVFDGAVLDFELGSVSDSDQIIVGPWAILIFSDGLGFSNFNFTTHSGFGEGTYTLIDIASLDFMDGGLGDNVTGMIGNYRGTLSLSDNGSVLLTTVYVPEPGTMTLLIMAGLGLLVCLTRRNRA